MARIPKKGTIEYRHYWRDRRVMDEINETVKEVKEVASDTSEPYRVEHYQQAVEYLQKAHACFKAGWELPYIKEPK